MQRLSTNLFRAIGAVSIIGAVAISAALAPQGASADTEKRIALVIGNGDYTAAAQIANSTGDARAVAASLKRLGFQVIEGYDLTIAQMRQNLARFSAALPDTQAAVVYYKGQGLSVEDENWILPTDIVVKSPTDLALGAISVSALLRPMQNGDRKSVVIIDACRDNSLAAKIADGESRAAVGGRGFSRVDSGRSGAGLARGTLIAFASDPDGAALECSTGPHSPFTEALLNHLEDRGAPFETVMNRVGAQVREATKNQQSPFVNTALGGEFALNPEAPPAKLGATPARAEPKAIVVAGVGDVAAPAAPTQARSDPQAAVIAPGEAPAPSAAVAVADPQAAVANVGEAPAPAAIESAAPQAAVVANVGEAPKPSAGAVASAEPKAISVESAAPAPLPALKSEIGTPETENSLNLGLAERKELQQRLAALDFEVGPPDGVFGEMTRSAIADWQEKHEAEPTGWLGPRQFATLKVESEASYQRLLAGPQEIPAQPADAAPKLAEPTFAKPPVDGRDDAPYSHARETESPACDD